MSSESYSQGAEVLTPDNQKKVLEFYQRYYQEEIAQLAQKYPQDQQSLTVDVSGQLYRYDPALADDVVDHPEKFRTLFEEALANYDLPVDVDLSDANVRWENANHTRKVDEVRKNDVDTLVTLAGQISKASAIRPVVKIAAWECQRCGSHTKQPVETELSEPYECQGCERQGPFTLDFHESKVDDHQLIRLKQPPEEATNSAHIGGELDANIEGDLVGYADAGERADVTGVLRADTGNNDKPTLEFRFEADAINKREEDYRELDIADHREEIKEIVEENPFRTLANSIAPAITGGREVEIETPWGETYDKYWWVRLAAGIANLFGSWRRPNEDGTYIRGDSHMILIGDPSTGKSTIMNAIAEIAPRSAMESGKNVSGAGLTAAAVNDDFGDSQWSLEAGALVKAHNGVACIDEIDKMDKQDLDRLHSALERQRLEFNKAGIDATLQCETSLLASGNPDGSRFSEHHTDQSQIDIVESLLDRFDLVYTFKDRPDEEKDRSIAESVIKQRSESGLVAKNKIDPDERTTAKPDISVETLQAWVAMARKQVEPVINDESVQQRIEDFYVGIRQENDNGNDEDEPVPATVRTLDGVLRLAEASARMRLSEEVELIDAEIAIALINVSLNDVGYDPETGKMDADWYQGRESHKQQDRRERMQGIIQQLETNESGADKEDVLNAAIESGMSESDATHVLEKLKNNGRVYEPQRGELRVA